MRKKNPTASITLHRPGQPLTRTQVLAALEPLMALLCTSPDQVVSLTITNTRVRLQLVPYQRGRRQLDSLLRVSYPITFDPEED